jgi:hypothetical protein
MHIVLRNYLRSGIAVGVMAILAVSLMGCQTPSKSRVNLFADTDYRMTVPGDVVAGKTTTQPGCWFSRPAIERLQAEKILP